MDLFENRDVKTGDLIISEPFLPDPNFSRTVVLICNEDDGHVGFVLNKKTDVKLSDLLDGWEGYEADIYLGGPVERNTLHFIHRHGDELSGAVKITENLFWGGDIEELKEKIELKLIDLKNIRFFIGYSGWGEGQLDQEQEEKSWIVVHSEVIDVIKDDPEDLWRLVLKKMGGAYKQLANYPIDPNLN